MGEGVCAQTGTGLGLLRSWAVRSQTRPMWGRRAGSGSSMKRMRSWRRGENGLVLGTLQRLLRICSVPSSNASAKNAILYSMQPSAQMSAFSHTSCLRNRSHISGARYVIVVLRSMSSAISCRVRSSRATPALVVALPKSHSFHVRPFRSTFSICVLTCACSLCTVPFARVQGVSKP